MNVFLTTLIEIAILLFPIFLFIREEFFSDKRTKKHKIVSRILYPILIIGIIATLYQRHQDGVKTDKFRNLLTTAIVKNELKTDELERIISEKYKSIFAATDKESKEWVEDFMRTLSQKREALTDLSVESNKLRDKYYLKWHPLYEYALTSFDKRISELELIDPEINMTKHEVPIVLAEDFSSFNETIRYVEFSNGNNIRVRLHPGKIEHGQLIGTPNLIFGQSIVGKYSGSVFIISFRENLYQLITGHPVLFRNVIKEIQTKEDPLMDTSFRGEVNKAITITIESMYLDGMGNQSSR